MTNVVAYARFSSDNQRDESIDAQVRAIRDFCKQNNYNLISTYHDNALSGTSVKDREQFLKMIKDSERKLFKFVIVHKFDRFARNRYDHAIFEKKLEDNGVRLISVLENLNDSPESVILKSVLTGMNEYYSLNLAREVRKGQKENALKCIHNGGRPPLGYDLTLDKTYTINEKESEAVKLIFKMYLDGRGYSSIADELNSMNYLNKLGRPFKKISIRDTLLNEKYTGTYIFGKKDKHGNITNKEIKVEDGIPAIISKEDFKKVLSKMRIRRHGSRNTAKANYLLTGLCICGECGGNFSGGYKSRNRNGSISRGYLCRNKKDKVNKCINTGLRKELLENLVLNCIKENIFSGEQIKIISERVYKYLKTKFSKRNKRMIEVESELKKLNYKANKLLDLNLDNVISDYEYKEKKNELDRQISDLNMEKIDLDVDPKFLNKQKIKNHLINLSKDLNSKDENIIKNIIEIFIENIIVYREKIKINLRLFPLADSANDGGEDGNRTRVQN